MAWYRGPDPPPADPPVNRGIGLVPEVLEKFRIAYRNPPTTTYFFHGKHEVNDRASDWIFAGFSLFPEAGLIGVAVFSDLKFT
jgi:hypothetical protein